MFVGHYGPGFVAKRLRDPIPLWILFVASQLLDIVWCTLVLLGVNKVRILHGYAQMDPYYMPYDHALDASLLWSLAGRESLKNSSKVSRIAATAGIWFSKLTRRAARLHDQGRIRLRSSSKGETT